MFAVDVLVEAVDVARAPSTVGHGGNVLVEGVDDELSLGLEVELKKRCGSQEMFKPVVLHHRYNTCRGRRALIDLMGDTPCAAEISSSWN